MSEQASLSWWTKQLRLEGYQVVSVRRDTPADPVRLTISATLAVGLCPRCHRPTAEVHRRLDSDPIRDLPHGPQAVALILRSAQFHCQRCDRYFTPPCPHVAPGVHATERCLEQAARLIRFSDFATAAAFLGVPEKTLERWYYDHVERQAQPPPADRKPIRSLGIDVLSLKKKHRQFVAVFIDHSNQRGLDVLEGRDKDLIVNYLRRHKDGLFAGLAEGTCDMWDASVNAAEEVFGESVRVNIDRFHVMKNVQEQLTEAWREVQRGLDKEAARELQGTRWLWPTNPEHLGEEQRQQLEGLKERCPRRKQLVEQHATRRAIFEDETIKDAASGTSRLRAGREQAKALGLKALDRFSKTLTNWLGRIANYFVWRSSNGRTEGFNHGLRAILWRAYGMLNCRPFRLRILDRFGQPANP